MTNFSAAAAARIPVIALDSEGLPQEQQFAAWAAHSRATILRPVHDGPFVAKGSMWDLGPVLVARTLLDPFTSDRTPHLVATAPAEFVQVNALRSGQVRLEMAGSVFGFEAPDLFLRDYSQPSRAVASRIDCETVYVQRTFLEEVTGVSQPLGQVLMVPEAAVLAATLASIVAELPHAAPTSAPLFARTLRDLLAAALVRNQSPSTRVFDERLLRAKRFIADQPPGTVTTHALVRELGLSRSVLYQLFQQEGGVLAYDRRRRMLELYRDLADVSQRETVAVLAARHGFLDPAGLARSFRRLFGRSPRDVRLSAQGGELGASPASVTQEVYEAVARLH